MSRSSTTTAAKAVDPMGLAQMRRAPTHPGAILAEALRAAGISQAEASRRLDVNRIQLNHVRVGRRPMSLELCARVAALTQTDAEYWATLQMRFDLWHVLRDATLVRALRHIEPIEAQP